MFEDQEATLRRYTVYVGKAAVGVYSASNATEAKDAAAQDLGYTGYRELQRNRGGKVQALWVL